MSHSSTEKITKCLLKHGHVNRIDLLLNSQYTMCSQFNCGTKKHFNKIYTCIRLRFKL